MNELIEEIEEFLAGQRVKISKMQIIASGEHFTVSISGNHLIVESDELEVIEFLDLNEYRKGVDHV